MSLLRVKDLHTCFKQAGAPVRAVDGVSFDIEAGQTFALVGESGCGKSMTALSALRLLPPGAQITHGAVEFNGQDVLRIPEYQMRRYRGARMAMIFQDPMTALNPVMSIGDQIAEAVRVHRPLSKARARARAIELLRQVGIPAPEQRCDEFAHQLSGGMRQRALIAIALASEPELLIADEPTTALDVTIQAEILALLKELQQQTGMALWLITHDLGIVAEMADQVAVMYAGELVEVAPKTAFFDHPMHPYSHKLFAALPEVDKRDTALSTLPGSVPRLNQTFSGCRFAPRCPHATDHCRQDTPGLRAMGARQQVRCHYAGELSAPQETVSPWADAAADLTHAGAALSVRDLMIHFPIRKGLFKRTVGQVRAVDGVSFEVPPGKTLALVGESGCGKTTLGKGILRLIEPTGGEVWYRDRCLNRLSRGAMQTARAELQMIFQDPFSSMNPRMLVGDIVDEGMRTLLPDLSAAQRRERAELLLQQVGLSAEDMQRYPHEFSGGQRQRICIARALAVDPALIVCDEPTSALDVSVQAQILNLLQQLQQERGLSYLFISHDLAVVAYLADAVAVMYLGRVVEYGSVAEVMDHPAHPYTQALLAAVPKPAAAGERDVIRLGDTLPSPANPPSGCHFHPRCPKAMSECKHTDPESIQLSDSHRVACLLFRNG